ncbi:hypothetical protein QWA68_016278 [Fusarium oxysporum]|nr:hypothetical protein QWA68_016278 [Fusarium oxysporum]
MRSATLDMLVGRRSTEFFSLVLIKGHPHLHSYDRGWNPAPKCYGSDSIAHAGSCICKERALQDFGRH